MQSLFAFLLLALLASATAFSVTSRLPSKRVRCLSKLSMADDDNVPKEDAEDTNNLSFNMNRIVRLGRSRDQDGKSNIWSIEPKMEVEKEEGNDGAKANLVVGAAAIGAAIACLPLFSLFSKMLPDPADF